MPVDVNPARTFDLFDLVGAKNLLADRLGARSMSSSRSPQAEEDPRRRPERGRGGLLMSPRDTRLHADDILQAIANIEADTAGVDFNGFAADRRARQQ
jgi:hypothetical protein